MDDDIAEEARDLLSGFVYCWACVYLIASIRVMKGPTCGIGRNIKDVKKDGCIYGKSPIPITKPL